MDKKIVINMLSSADKVEGQGVGSAYLEQVNLVKEGASDLFTVEINSGKKADIIHSHTIDPQNYLKMKNNKNANVCYVHFLPDTLNGSIQLPKALFSVFKKYVISFYKTADYLIVVNPIFMKELEKYGIAREKMIYIPNYVSKEQFHVKPVEQRNAIRELCGQVFLPIVTMKLCWDFDRHLGFIELEWFCRFDKRLKRDLGQILFHRELNEIP